MGPHFEYCLRATNNPSYFAVSGSSEAAALEAACTWASPTPVRYNPEGTRHSTEGTRLTTESYRHSTEGSNHTTEGSHYTAERARYTPEGTRSLRRPRRLTTPGLVSSTEHSRRPELRALLRTMSGNEQNIYTTHTAPRIMSGKISASSCREGVRSEREEVFYTLPLQRRRHSVGGYLAAEGVARGAGCEAGRVTAVPSEVPRQPPPRLTPAPTHTRRRNKNFNFKQMEDIAIVSSKESPESELWSDYLLTCFDKIMSQRARHHYRVTPITVEELLDRNTTEHAQKIASAQLQILIICPKMAAKLTDLRKATENVDELFKREKVLAMLLGVEREDIVAHNDKEFPNIDEWQMMVVREKDSSFVDNFLTAAVGILRTKDCKDTATDKTSFSIVPKKVKIGQSRVIALLNDPIREEDSIKIMVDKKGEAIPITTYKKRNPYTLQFDIPECCLDMSMLVWVRISKNGQPLGRRQIKCESRLRELDQILRASDHPLEFICQTLGFKTTNRDQLDSWMLAAFQKNIPPHFNLLASPEQYNPKSNIPSTDEYPTLLHFAARFGLERLCWQLLECPGGATSCGVRNARLLTPADLARQHGHTKLADVLASHLQINEFSNMYYYLKNMTENKDDNDENESNELRIVEAGDTVDGGMTPKCDELTSEEQIGSTDPFSEECTQNLEQSMNDSPQNEHSEANLIDFNVTKYERNQLYQNEIFIQPTNPELRIQQAIEHDYLVQPSNIKVETENRKMRPNNLYVNSSALIPQPGLMIYSPTEEIKSLSIDTPTSDISQINLSLRDTRSCSGSIKSNRETGYPLSGQDELAEIINDFKNNVFTISEVENLVMEWKNRNETQQSLKEKQEQLNKMRDEYDRIQQKIKESMKRPTPFERVKRIFLKGKNKNGDAGIEKRNGNIRPNSSLSESSASSGRLSTVSGGSFGENSLHSEITTTSDDKRGSSSTVTLQSSVVDIDTKLDDYLIPPPPRPLNGTNYPVALTTFGHSKAERTRSGEVIGPGRHMATIVEKDLSQSQDRLDKEATHVRLNFEGVCRSNSLPEGPGKGHMYMNIAPSNF